MGSVSYMFFWGWIQTQPYPQHAASDGRLSPWRWSISKWP